MATHVFFLQRRNGAEGRLYGVDVNGANEIVNVLHHYSAQERGMRAGDKILSTQYGVENSANLLRAARARPRRLVLVVRRPSAQR